VRYYSYIIRKSAVALLTTTVAFTAFVINVDVLAEDTSIDLCNNIDGDWYYYYPPDEDFPDDIIFGKILMNVDSESVNNGLTNVQSVVLNLNDKSTTFDEYVETWQCNKNKLIFEGYYDDGSTYSFGGDITFADKNRWVWDDGELGIYIFSSRPHFMYLDMIDDIELKKKVKTVIGLLTQKDGSNPLLWLIDGQ